MTRSFTRYMGRTLSAFAILIVLAIPANALGASAGVLAPDENRRDDAQPAAVTESVNGESSALRFESSLDYVYPDPPPTRFEEECRPIPRLCNWLRGHDALIETQERSSSESSGISWQSGSYTSFQSSNAAGPATLEVPSLSIEATVEGVGVGRDREMEVPDRRNTVGWYQYGPAPGETGSAVIAGHLDDYYGRSVFFHLQHIEMGALVVVTSDDGTVTEFAVVEKTSYDATKLPSAKLFSREGDPRLALITCGGRWDASAGRYTETVVVYAEPV